MTLQTNEQDEPDVHLVKYPDRTGDWTWCSRFLDDRMHEVARGYGDMTEVTCFTCLSALRERGRWADERIGALLDDGLEGLCEGAEGERGDAR